MKMLADIAKGFANLIYPLHCASCGRQLDSADERRVCGFCIGQIKRNPAPHCKICGKSKDAPEELCADCGRTRPHFDKACSAYLYEGALKELIHLFKYSRKLYLSRILSDLMMAFIKETPYIINEIDIITFVPLQPRRLRERGFNQSRILAHNIAKGYSMPLLDTLQKVKTTRPQNELSRPERLVNLDNVFRVRKDVFVRGSKILLIDDVMTTGATLNACSKVLRDAGAKGVTCLTLSRGI